jgi:hypothetical protein
MASLIVTSPSATPVNSRAFESIVQYRGIRPAGSKSSSDGRALSRHTICGVGHVHIGGTTVAAISERHHLSRDVRGGGPAVHSEVG